MKINLKLCQEGRTLLEQLQEPQQIKITLKEKKTLSIYSELMKLKLSMYYTPDNGKLEGILILKDKYKDLDLNKIDESINEARKKISIMAYLNTLT
jgi:hypothetical protein